MFYLTDYFIAKFLKAPVSQWPLKTPIPWPGPVPLFLGFSTAAMN